MKIKDLVWTDKTSGKGDIRHESRGLEVLYYEVSCFKGQWLASGTNDEGRSYFHENVDSAEAGKAFCNEDNKKRIMEWVEEPQDKILASLSPDAKQIWLDIKDVGTDKAAAAQVLLAQNGAAMKQRLFVLGLMETNFQVARVQRLLNISKKEMDIWVRDYPEFQELISEIQFLKRSLAEEALFDLVLSREPRAVLFANERLNKETYGNEVKVTGEVAHTQGVLDLAALGLPFELEKQILAHISSKALLDSDGTLITGNL